VVLAELRHTPGQAYNSVVVVVLAVSVKGHSLRLALGHSQSPSAVAVHPPSLALLHRIAVVLVVR